MAASYFDVDGTLVSTNLVHPTLYYLLNQGMPHAALRKLGRALVKGPSMAIAELIDRRTFNELLYSSYEGMSEDRLLLLARDAFESVMRPSVYPLARDLVDSAKAGGRKVVLVSGALDVLLRHVADYFGADELIGNVLEMKDGICTGKLLGPVVAGPEKARLVREHARARGHDLDDCYAFSDSYSDLPMLSVVGHPAAVNPDRRLRILARAYRWPSFDLRKQP